MRIKKNKKKRAIFLDRDGTLILALKKSKYKIRPPYIKRELKFYKDIKLLKKFNKNYLLIIISNQPDISRGLLKEEFNKYINNKLTIFLGLTDIFMCFDKKSNCYKPKTLMIKRAIKKYNIDKNKSYVIGDTWRDIKMGNDCKVKTILIDRKYPKYLTRIKDNKPTFIINKFKDLKKIIPNDF